MAHGHEVEKSLAKSRPAACKVRVVLREVERA